MRNQAFAFIKPHAMNSQAAATYIEDVFEDENIKVSFKVRKTSREVAGLIDRHFGRVADIAFTENVSSLDPGEEGRGLFRDAFGEDWDDAVADGCVLNCHQARARMDDASAKDLCTEWAKYGAVEIAPDFFVSWFEEQEAYVLNGFYPVLRESYVADDAAVLVMLLDFEMDWHEFHEAVVGCDNPAAALEDSIRGYLYDLAAVLEMIIDPVDNIMHVSASPFEALCEKMVWLDEAQWMKDPLLLAVAEKTGKAPAEVAAWIFERRDEAALRATFADIDTPLVAAALADSLKSEKTS